MNTKKQTTLVDEKERMEKIELAKIEFSLKHMNGPVPITPMDVAKLVGMEDEYREALAEQENEMHEAAENFDDDLADNRISDQDVLDVLNENDIDTPAI